MDWQFSQRKRRHAARCEVEPRAALRLGPMHVIGMLVSHGSYVALIVSSESYLNF